VCALLAAAAVTATLTPVPQLSLLYFIAFALIVGGVILYNITWERGTPGEAQSADASTVETALELNDAAPKTDENAV